MKEIGYPMRQWFFEDSAGRFDIDLGDSYARCGTLAELSVPADMELGYGYDRGGPGLRAQIGELYGGPAGNVVVAHGAQEALYLLYNVLLRPGDRVMTFRPGWQQSWLVPDLLGCAVDVLDLDGDFSIDVDAVRAAAGIGHRLIVLNTPCNPTGRRIPEQTLAELLELVTRLDAYLVLDEEYETDLSGSLAARSDRAISVSGLSKVYGYAGLRLGWMYGPPELMAACAERKHLTTIANSVLSEELASDILARRSGYVRRYQDLISGGRGLLGDWVDGHGARLGLVEPEGTPFAWVHLLTGETSLDFCRRVLETGVLLVPGETLGGSGGFRLSFARPPAVLAEGLARIDTVLHGGTGARIPRQAAKTTTGV
ncbi:pyridoxal phosphate-dependent aminotransferase [Longispora albida]|uniref:pyridoxal phosphate-dependent aminotransferase n=1 Tax=Longispora albida TaxID=203523 RepID=UPI00035CDF15|nr:pyridoxal phosphate-dependent aminotransferase [Longispora albida]